MTRPPAVDGLPAAAGRALRGDEARSWSVASPAELAALADEWEALAARGEFPLVCDPAWTTAFIDAFGSDGAPVSVQVLRTDGRLRAVVPLRRSADGARWLLAENHHHPYASLALDHADPAVAAEVLHRLLADARCLVLPRVHEDGALARALVAAAHAGGYPVTVARSEHGDAYLPLASSWPEVKASLSKNITRDIPRKTRKLEQLGPLAFDRIDGGPALLEQLEECFHLETLGWKGVSGSPIVADPRTRVFYTELARRAADRGTFALYTLRSGSRLVAFEYCRRGGGRIDMLKLSFDPAFSDYSPGGILRLRIFEREVAEGAVRAYHLGRPSEWKMRWAAGVRPLCTLRIYGRGLRARAEYAWEGPVRRALKRAVAALPARSRSGAP